MKAVFTAAARIELQAIGDYIASDNPRRAITFIDEIEQHCEKLARRPRMHPLVRGHEEDGVRKAGHGNYLIFYRMAGDIVEILHIVHGAQDWERILAGDEAFGRLV